ncbi:MAG: alpha/beta hydrolase [Deltaproteobacteria bacterium]|nr:alpha/beta hydrolase [Deltaproteobacteria bacterium]
MDQENFITLRDSRRLGYALFGSPSLKDVVFYFHGFPGSRLEVGFAHEAALHAGITLIGLDRPGFGLSTDYPSRQILAWPSDVLEAADVLAIQKFSILGISGGTPYALACALKIPDRIRRVAVVSGLGSVEIPGALPQMNFFNRQMLHMAAKVPFAARLLVGRLTKALHKHPQAMIRWLMTVSPPSDKVILKRPDVRRILADNFREGLRGGGAGIAHELALIARPWGFSPKDISLPVLLWHGTADDYVPLCMGQYHSRVIPGCQSHFVEDGGHFMVISLIDEILAKLKASS